MDIRTKAFRTFKEGLMELINSRSTLKTPQVENKFIEGVRIKSTAKPEREYSYNETFININQQLKIK